MPMWSAKPSTGSIATSGARVAVTAKRTRAARGARSSGNAFGVEGVAGGTDGANQVGLAAGIDRLAQPPNVNVDGPQFDVAVVAPDRVEQPLAREDPTRPLEEMAQQAELGRAQCH